MNKQIIRPKNISRLEAQMLALVLARAHCEYKNSICIYKAGLFLVSSISIVFYTTLMVYVSSLIGSQFCDCWAAAPAKHLPLNYLKYSF